MYEIGFWGEELTWNDDRAPDSIRCVHLYHRQASGTIQGAINPVNMDELFSSTPLCVFRNQILEYSDSQFCALIRHSQRAAPMNNFANPKRIFDQPLYSIDTATKSPVTVISTRLQSLDRRECILTMNVVGSLTVIDPPSTRTMGKYRSFLAPTDAHHDLSGDDQSVDGFEPSVGAQLN